MNRIQELLGNVTGLSDDELEELRDLVIQMLDDEAVEGDDAGLVASLEWLEWLASVSTSVRNERDRRKKNIERVGQAREVLASFRSGGGTGHAVVPADRRPNRSAMRSSRAVTASGSPLHDANSIADEFITAMRTQRAPNTRDGRVLVATLHAERGADRTLHHNDAPEVVTAAVEAAAEAHAQRAITAAGGLAAPEQPDYELVGFEVTDRPVTGSLPKFTADRGGVRFIRPPSLSDLNGATGIWTVPDDIAAVNNPAVRKPSIRVAVGGEVVVQVQAVTSILTWGNLMARAYPEFITRVTELAAAHHAKIAEQQVLTQIGALSTPVSGVANEGGNLGATRVLLPLLDRAATGMRDRLRMQADAPLQLILPNWCKGILRTDLALQEPGDAQLGVTDAELVSYLATRNLSTTWAMDGEAGQHFDPQAPGPVNAWPTSIVSYMFPAGAMQFLDGGTLDLGLIRDSTLNAANDFQTFMETFEAVLFRGGESFRISQAITPSGISRAAA